MIKMLRDGSSSRISGPAILTVINEYRGLALNLTAGWELGRAPHFLPSGRRL